MKHIAQIMIILILLLAVTGCNSGGDAANRVSSGNNVDKIINEQIDKAESESSSGSPDKNTSSKPGENSKEYEKSSKKNGNDFAEADYDLTNMNSDMVYATVYQMMVDPNAYIGKTVRMDGMHYADYYEPTAKYYHYCIIQDALACCAQGMEFVWEDGSHIYPDEYPAENTKIVVQGIFETYREEGDDNLYCRLKDAVMQVINE